jgi:hypothetical protein
LILCSKLGSEALAVRRDSALRAVRLATPEQEAHDEAQHEHGRDARELAAPGEPKTAREAQIPEWYGGVVDLVDFKLHGELRSALIWDGVTVRELHGSVS